MSMSKEILSLESHPAVEQLIKKVKENKQEKELTFSMITKLIPQEILNHEDFGGEFIYHSQ